MNLLPARTLEIEVNEGVSLLRFETLGWELIMIGLEPPRGLMPGSRVELGIKATHIILSRDLPEKMALSNALPVRSWKIVSGKLLVSVTLECQGTLLEAILPRPSFEKLEMKEGEELYALFQAAELSVVKVLG